MLTEAVIVAVVTAAATVLCQLIISRRTSNLMAYRIEQLEHKVEKHNQVVERLYAVEAQAQSNAHRLDELER